MRGHNRVPQYPTPHCAEIVKTAPNYPTPDITAAVRHERSAQLERFQDFASVCPDVIGNIPPRIIDEQAVHAKIRLGTRLPPNSEQVWRCPVH
jgi:hypothetical protein